MPTTLDHSELQNISAAIRERSFFSARNSMGDILDTLKNAVAKIINPTQEPGASATSGLNVATARLGIKQALADIGYTPEAGTEGTIQDLGSDQRITLAVQTNVDMARGFGKWRSGQDQDLLDAFPAQELYRLGDRMEPRDWLSIWKEHGGELFSGRMIALKNAPIWTAISAFNTPWPPFDFNSGMWTKDIARDEAVSLGLLEDDTTIPPQDRSFELKIAA